MYYSSLAFTRFFPSDLCRSCRNMQREIVNNRWRKKSTDRRENYQKSLFEEDCDINYKLFSRTRCLMCSRFLSGVEQCKAQLCTQCESIGGMRRVSSSESAFIASNPSPSFAALFAILIFQRRTKMIAAAILEAASSNFIINASSRPKRGNSLFSVCAKIFFLKIWNRGGKQFFTKKKNFKRTNRREKPKNVSNADKIIKPRPTQRWR